MKNVKTLLILTLSASILCACAGRRSSSENNDRTGLTGLKPSEKNPSRSVLNATGDGLTPGIAQTRGAGDRENAERIGNGAINKARASVQASGGAVVQPTATLTPEIFASAAVDDHRQMRADLAEFEKGPQGIWRDSVNVSITNVTPAFKVLIDPAAKQNTNDQVKSLSTLIKAYRSAVSSFEVAAKSEDAAVRAYAIKYLPVLKRHLTQAQTLMSKVE